MASTDPTYDDGKPQGQWTVIVDCTAENGHALGVVPTEVATSTVISDARVGKYNDLLIECS